MSIEFSATTGKELSDDAVGRLKRHLHMKRTLATDRPLLVRADGWRYPEAVR